MDSAKKKKAPPRGRFCFLSYFSFFLTVAARLTIRPAPSALSELFGTGETEKVMIWGTAKEEEIPAVYDLMKEKFRFEEKNTGIAFTVPVKSVSGPAALALLAGLDAVSGEVKK